MLEQVLALFPPHIHPLTLVSDPDDVLADETILALLSERGFRLIAERDPIALRYTVQHAMPISAATPVIIITAEPLETLAYDLWQQGAHVELALHQFFPNLAYPALRELSPNQRQRLSTVQAQNGGPSAAIGYQPSLDYLLQTVFEIAPNRVRSVADWLAWLDRYHAHNDPMSALLAQRLLKLLERSPTVADLPLSAMVGDATAYAHFVQQQWASYVHNQLKERADGDYGNAPALPFATDHAMQDLVGRLVRNGTIVPLAVTAALPLPSWTAPAIVPTNVDVRQQQWAEGLAWLEQHIAADLRWEQWQLIARRWAQLTTWRATGVPLEQPQLDRFGQLQARLDSQFTAWIGANYTPLATRALPVPHHLHHVPGWLAQQQHQQPTRRLALLIIDGMALADWLQIRDLWQARNPNWRIDERLVLAQIPSITAISRQALISGRRPAQFAATLLHNRNEQHHWSQFWQAHGLPANASAYATLATYREAAYPDVIESRHTQVLCLVSSVLDNKVHSESQGAVGWQATLGVWLHSNEAQHQSAAWLENLINHLHTLRYTVVITSDHGHVEAQGMGTPQEGVLVETRSKRARIYANSDIVRIVQMQFAHTLLWENDGILPAQTRVLVAQGRRAFAPFGALIVSHGGLSIEELIVPLATITQG